MHRFMVVLEERNSDGSYTDRYLEKIFMRDMQPSVGTTIVVAGNGYLITGVDYELECNQDDDRAVLVRAPIDEFDFGQLREEDKTWIFREGYAS